MVEDHEMWRRFYSTALQKRPELQVIAEVSDGLEAVEKAKELKPDLILLDVGLPTLNGIEAAQRIREFSSDCKILFVSENRSTDIVEKALSSGAGGYVLKSDVGSELLPAVMAVLEGKRFVSTSLCLQGVVALDATASDDRHRIESNPYLQFGRNASFSEFLESVIDATAADYGNVQILDSKNRVLRIVAHHGFESEFLGYFDSVSCDDHCTCGAAMKARSRMVITDVAADPLFSDEARGVIMRANVRSVQATPLVDSLGRLVGMLSTHYSRPGGVTADVLKQVDNFVTSLSAKINT